MRLISNWPASSASERTSPALRSSGINLIELFGSATFESIGPRQPASHQKCAGLPAASLDHWQSSAPVFQYHMQEKALKDLQEADRSFHLHPFTNHLEMHP